MHRQKGWQLSEQCLSSLLDGCCREQGPQYKAYTARSPGRRPADLWWTLPGLTGCRARGSGNEQIIEVDGAVRSACRPRRLQAAVGLLRVQVRDACNRQHPARHRVVGHHQAGQDAA